MFAVHIEQLSTLSADLERVSAAVRQNARHGLAEELVGNGPVAEAMRSVEHDWSRQRGRICGFLSALSVGAGSAADLYAAVETELVKSLTPAGAVPPAVPPVSPGRRIQR